ncbi:MAG: hypothetical protein WCC21_16555 [Candidatus Acidiferrales bacterium]
MHRRPFIMLVLALSTTVTAISTRAQDQPAARPASSDRPQPAAGTNPAAQNPAPDPGKPKRAAANPAAENSAAQGTTPHASARPATAQDDDSKPAEKVHHVITNDDIEAEHERLASANSDVDIGNINDCDRTCFDFVRGNSNYWLKQNTDWQRDLLHGIEQVSADAKWQAALFQIARMKARFCDLSQEKNDVLANIADPRKMTEEEISVDEEYDRKFKAQQAELNSAFAQADAVIGTYGGIVVAFMNLQKQRAGNRVCVIRSPVRYRPYNSPRDDPDDP